VELQLEVFFDRNTLFRLPEDVRDKVIELRAGVGAVELYKTYEVLYEMNTKPGTRDRKYAVKAYKVMMACQTPLDAHSLAQAVAIDTDGAAQHYVDAEYVLDITRNFLTRDGKSSSIRFAHLSLIEYLHTRLIDSHTWGIGDLLDQRPT
jgi:GTP cyclohydrolase III